MKKVLLTGFTGMLGSEVYSTLKEEFEIYLLSTKKIKKKRFLNFDLRKKNFKVLKNWVKPDVIIHCAAETNIDFCEKRKKNCKEINFESVKKLIKCFPESKFIFISSDSVYSGNKPHSENALKKPLNYYGLLKLKSEDYVKKFSKNYFILRTTPVGFTGFNNKKTFVSWIIESVKRKKRLNLFVDAFFSPISSKLLVKEIKHIITKDLTGVFNVSSRDSVSKYEFGKRLCKSLKLNTSYLHKADIGNIKLFAKRNPVQILNCNLYQKKFSRSLPSVSLTIKDLSNNYSLSR